MPNGQAVQAGASILDVAAMLGPKILFAILCGGIIGLERELKHKAAGIKTNMLICLGSAIFTTASVLLSTHHTAIGYYGDPGRVAAQIVSGIGFLGGGAIIQSRGTIHGLTTAATIWVVAAVGMCIGLGYEEIALGSSVLVVFVLVCITTFEDRVLGRWHFFALEVLVDNTGEKITKAIQSLIEENDLSPEDFEMISKGESCLFSLSYRGDRSAHKKFLLGLWSMAGVREVRQL